MSFSLLQAVYLGQPANCSTAASPLGVRRQALVASFAGHRELYTTDHTAGSYSIRTGGPPPSCLTFHHSAVRFLLPPFQIGR